MDVLLEIAVNGCLRYIDRIRRTFMSVILILESETYVRLRFEVLAESTYLEDSAIKVHSTSVVISVKTNRK